MSKDKEVLMKLKMRKPPTVGDLHWKVYRLVFSARCRAVFHINFSCLFIACPGVWFVIMAHACFCLFGLENILVSKIGNTILRECVCYCNPDLHFLQESFNQIILTLLVFVVNWNINREYCFVRTKTRKGNRKETLLPLYFSKQRLHNFLFIWLPSKNKTAGCSVVLTSMANRQVTYAPKFRNLLFDILFLLNPSDNPSWCARVRRMHKY